MKRFGLLLFWSIATPVIAILWLWSIGAIYFSNLPAEGLRRVCAWAFALVWPAAFAFAPRRQRTAAIFAIVFGLLLAWWLSIAPSHDRDWRPEVARLPWAEIREEQATVHDVRDFEYRTAEDFTPRYYDRTYDLRELETVDFIKSQWGVDAIAHTLLSFGFRDGSHVVVSVETRLEKGEPQSGLRGLFKQYELIYVLGDERDLLRVRTNFRGEEVYVYPTRITKEEARIAFLDILETANDIRARPRFYNTLAHNCTTSLGPHLAKARGRKGCDLRVLLNGESDQLAFERGTLAVEPPFVEARLRHHVNQYVKDGPDAVDYSRRIRPYLQQR